MEKNLPKGWEYAELDSLFNLSYGKGLKTEELLEDGFDVYGANGIIGKFSRYTFEESQVIISCRGAASGVIHKTNSKSFVTSNSIVLDRKSNEKLNLDFVKYAMTSIDKSEVITGTAQPQITIQLLKHLILPFPPLPEQERIVAKLDSVFAHLEVAKQGLEKIPVLLKEFRQAVLTQAVTGKLTEKWREGKELVEINLEIKIKSFRKFKKKLPKEWREIAFGDFAEIKSNLVNPDLFWDFPMIAPDNIEKETGRLINIPLVSEIQPKSGKHHYNEEVILYSKIRPYLSKLTIVDFEGLCSADMYPIICKMNLNYLFYYMLSQEYLEFATTAGERSVLPKINQKSMEVIPVPVPPQEEQTEIVHRVEALFSKADAIEAQYKKLKEQIDQLPQAVLAKAFRGEV